MQKSCIHHALRLTCDQGFKLENGECVPLVRPATPDFVGTDKLSIDISMLALFSILVCLNICMCACVFERNKMLVQTSAEEEEFLALVIALIQSKLLRTIRPIRLSEREVVARTMRAHQIA